MEIKELIEEIYAHLDRDSVAWKTIEENANKEWKDDLELMGTIRDAHEKLRKMV